MWEGVLGDLCGRFVGECPRWSVTSIKLHGCFVGVAFQCGCSPVNILLFLGGGEGGGGFHDSTSGGLLLRTEYIYI